MPFCGTCGAPVEGRFCAKCGTPAPAAAPAAPPPPAPQQNYTPPPPPQYQQPPQQQYVPPQQQYVPPQQQYAPPQQQYAPQQAGLADNVAATLCYALGLITGILFLVMEPYSKNRAIRFHAFQCIFMSVAVFASYIVLAILDGILFSIGIWWLIPIINMVFFLAVMALWIALMVMAFQGRKFVLPVIGPLAEKQA